jgi:acyl carrier protein
MFEKLKSLIAEQLDVDEEKVTENANIQDDLGADSLDVVDLIMAIEEEFDIEIPDGDAESIKTVGDIEKYIEAHQD